MSMDLSLKLDFAPVSAGCFCFARLARSHKTNDRALSVLNGTFKTDRDLATAKTKKTI